MQSQQDTLPGSGYEYGRVALFAPIPAPMFCSVDPIQAAHFFKEYKQYELEVLSEQVELLSLQPTSYTASVDRSLLKHLVLMVNVDDVAPDANVDSLTSESTKHYMFSLVNTEDQVHDPVRLYEAMASLMYPSNLAGPVAYITTYCADIFERLGAFGFGELQTENPKHTICLLLDRIRPPALKTAIEEKVEDALEKILQLFNTSVKENAKAVNHLDRNCPLRT